MPAATSALLPADGGSVRAAAVLPMTCPGSCLATTGKVAQLRDLAGRG
jgi:hypothetical protein